MHAFNEKCKQRRQNMIQRANADGPIAQQHIADCSLAIFAEFDQVHGQELQIIRKNLEQINNN